MGVAERSRDRVEEMLANLKRRYEAFPVDQTTMTLSRADYRRVADRCREGIARVDVRVRNADDEVLMVETDGELTLPGRILEDREAIEREAQVAVHRASGVECAVEGIDRATIAGVDSEGDTGRATLYRLLVVLRASHVEGSPTADCQWRGETPSVELLR